MDGGVLKQGRITIRKTRDTELLAVLNSRIFIFEHEYLGWELEASTWWIAWIDGMPAGFAGVRKLASDEDTWYLSRSGVLYAARGRGIQKRMIKARERHAKAHGGKTMLTYTSCENPASMNSLIKCGYKTYMPPNRWGSMKPHEVYWEKEL